MKYTYYLHDSKEDAALAAGEVLKEMGEVSNEEDDAVLEHPLFQTIYSNLYVHEVDIEFEFSEDMKDSTPRRVLIHGKWYNLSE